MLPMMHRALAYTLQVPKAMREQRKSVRILLAYNFSKPRCIPSCERVVSGNFVHMTSQKSKNGDQGSKDGHSKRHQARWCQILPSISAVGLIATVGIQSKDEPKETPRQKLNFIAECAEQAVPAVVHIENRRSYDGSGAGSGFIISKDGLILTNEHVVTSAQNLTVKLHDGRVFPGTVLVVDSNSDLAIVKINETDLPVISLGDSSSMKAGEFVIAIGSPKGFSHTVTTGIISSKARNLSKLGISTNIDYLQTDAAITQGNSGGPLLNLDGEVVGINSMKIVDGIAFAIPSNYLKEFLAKAEKFRAEAAERRRLQPPYVGLSLLPLSESVTDQLKQRWYLRNLNHDSGLLAVRIDTGSPADQAGLQQYDVIVAIDGVPVNTVADLSNAINNKKSVTVQFNRMGKDIKTTLTPTPRQ